MAGRLAGRQQRVRRQGEHHKTAGKREQFGGKKLVRTSKAITHVWVQLKSLTGCLQLGDNRQGGYSYSFFLKRVLAYFLSCVFFTGFHLDKSQALNML